MKKLDSQTKHSLFWSLGRKRRGSPLVEEGILIGLSLFGFLLIFSIVTGILDWLLMNADELLRELGSFFT